MDEDKSLEMAENVMEIDAAIRETIELINEAIGDSTDTIEVPVVALQGVAKILTQTTVCIKSLYEFWAAYADSVQEDQK